MKLVYCSHPYGGDPVEAADADKAIKELAKRWPGVAFISPIHAIRRDYQATDYETGIKACLALEDRCDAIVFLHGVGKKWQDSIGCMREFEHAARNPRIAMLTDSASLLLWALLMEE